MKIIFPHLAIGSSGDAYNTLYMGFWQEVTMVLDVTSDMPTNKWNQMKLKLRRVGLQDMSKAKLNKVIGFIHEHRKLNEMVLVVSKDSKRAALVVVAYLAAKKSWTFDQCMQRIEAKESEFDLKELVAVKKFVAALPRVEAATATVKAVASAPVV